MVTLPFTVRLAPSAAAAPVNETFGDCSVGVVTDTGALPLNTTVLTVSSPLPSVSVPPIFIVPAPLIPPAAMVTLPANTTPLVASATPAVFATLTFWNCDAPVFENVTVCTVDPAKMTVCDPLAANDVALTLCVKFPVTLSVPLVSNPVSTPPENV